MALIALHAQERPVGIPLVLLPAFPLDFRMWKRVRKRLPGVPVIIADPPGFGDSQAGTYIAGRLGLRPQPSLDTYAHGLAAALDALGIEQIVLAGVSMGGYTAMAFADLFPERLRGIGLLDTTAEADTITKRENRLAMASALRAGAAPGRLLSGMRHDVVSPVTAAERSKVSDRLDHWFEQASAPAIVWAQEAMAARPARLAALERLQVPALVVRGTDDGISSPEAATAMADALGTEVLEIPRAGHLAAVENPDAVADALRDLWEAARL